MKISHVHFNKGIKELKKLTKLKKLTLNGSNNTIREEGIYGICDIFTEIKTLEEIELILRQYILMIFSSEISDKGFSELVKSLGLESLKKLKLNLIGNWITEKGMEKQTF